MIPIKRENPTCQVRLTLATLVAGKNARLRSQTEREALRSARR